jgi:response regulator of citrate/malate metabolism
MQLWYVCFTCIGISSLVSRRVRNLLVCNKLLQATVAKHLPISHVKMKAYLITLHYSNLLTSSLRFSDSNLVPPEYIPD